MMDVFSPSTLEAEAERCLSSRLTWFTLTLRIPGQPRLHSETPFQTQNKTEPTNEIFFFT